ncbi:glycosyltransferase family 2 protein [Methanosarcina sp.]|uniref:glycosyltransferase family 2 protein n=1 Tax=Methanosarcina sp. TaxID=2213 RepID=UPI0029884390|nr:glycosyltransferase family 2 protein [Methanosarcina sp.]MDW5549187.1 glycosyltransferase family 2 protein [Methanosarcina sp.]MDW5553107.1 glycosyltransferase family 2 protein [Methanosarcina sp.]MDW5559367.1 glycosyltransferase family 2 protein [Methanosarcina sp.]
MKSKVSILIPVYNREKYIKEAVLSALNQTYENIEIVIVDNKSTENTWSIVKDLAKKDKRIKIFQNETNIGPVKNWKRCIDEATGEYGKILWSDDLIAPSFIENTISFLKENDDVGFVYTGAEIFVDGTSQKKDVYFIGDTGVYSSEQYIKGILFSKNFPVSPGCALFRLSDLKKNLLIDIPNKIGSDFSTHAIGNDLLIFLLTAHQYRKFAFVNEKLSFFRAHDGSISIQSNNGKLTLYYDITKAYFVENFREDLIPELNKNIWIHLRKYPDAKKYNMNSLEDFYVKNPNFEIVWSWKLIINIIRVELSKVFTAFVK